MIVNQKCDSCKFQTKCKAQTKLKPFTEEARVDLGVELEFLSCVDYQDMESADAETPNEDY